MRVSGPPQHGHDLNASRGIVITGFDAKSAARFRPVPRMILVVPVALVAPSSASFATLRLHPNLRRAPTLFPHRDLPVLIERRQRIPAHLAQQVLVIAQAIRADAFAHRASGLVGMPANAEPASSCQGRAPAAGA